MAVPADRLTAFAAAYNRAVADGLAPVGEPSGSYDTYALNLGYGQAQDRGQSIAAVCDPVTGSMQCFADLDQAAAYLNFLRRPRVRVKAA